MGLESFGLRRNKNQNPQRIESSFEKEKNMECSCTIDVDNDGGPTCHKEKIRTASKEHQCCECFKKIVPGEKYEYVFGIWDSEPHIYKTCLDCKSVRDTFFGSWTYTQVWADFHDCDSEIPESCISELTPGARARVCEYIEDCWDLD